MRLVRCLTARYIGEWSQPTWSSDCSSHSSAAAPHSKFCRRNDPSDKPRGERRQVKVPTIPNPPCRRHEQVAQKLVFLSALRADEHFFGVPSQEDVVLYAATGRRRRPNQVVQAAESSITPIERRHSPSDFLTCLEARTRVMKT